MTIIESIILGIIQGLTEFLPVSSSGHLVLFEKLMGHHDVPLLYDILLHFASLLAVIIFFRKKLTDLTKGFFNISGFNKDHKYVVMLFISTLITGLMLFVTKPLVEVLRGRPVFLSVTFGFTALILFAAQYFLKKRHQSKEITYADAVVIGLFQGIAVLPGVSRSGSTIAAALFRKIPASDAFEYSFLLAVPAILGALVIESAQGSFSGIDPVVAVAGFAASFFASVAALKMLVFLIKKTVLYPFGIYLIILSWVVIYIKM
jgi:undecaprenyl-diphosphatase